MLSENECVHLGFNRRVRTVSLNKIFPLTAGPVSNPDVCFQVQYKLDPRYKRTSMHRLYVAAHCPFVLIKPESKQISHWVYAPVEYFLYV